MSIILFLLGLILTADAIAVIVSFGPELGAAMTAVIGIILLVWCANYKDVREWTGFKRFLKWCFKIFIVYIIGMSCFAAAYGNMDYVTYNEDYVIVLGARVDGSNPSFDLKSRLDTAIEYHNQNPRAKIIVSGGKGYNETLPEAYVMYNYLEQKGIPADCIIKEEKSNNTYENFKNSDEILGGALKNSEVVVVTNDFHMFRAKLYAKMANIDASTMSAPTRLYMIPVSYVRESLAMIKMLIYYIPLDKLL